MPVTTTKFTSVAPFPPGKVLNERVYCDRFHKLVAPNTRPLHGNPISTVTRPRMNSRRGLPPVVVAVCLSDCGISKYQNIRRLSRRPDAALSSSAATLVEHGSLDHFSQLQVPARRIHRGPFRPVRRPVKRDVGSGANAASVGRRGRGMIGRLA